MIKQATTNKEQHSRSLSIQFYYLERNKEAGMLSF